MNNKKTIMTIDHYIQILKNKQKLSLAIFIVITLVIVTNILLDFTFTVYQNSVFYISESLLFSSYWLLFFPMPFLFIKLVRKTKNLSFRLIFLGSVISFHMLIYPALIWIISGFFYEHTFDYWQTLNYGLSAYFIKTVVIYGFSFLVFELLKNNTQSIDKDVDKKVAKSILTSLLVTDSNNIKVSLKVNDIFYFSANSPYINIHHSEKKYLHSETLRSLEEQLDESQFVRIHKSCIVNLNKIRTVQSRQNGDHDITLSDNTVLRVSRNYARKFKASLSEKQHQLTAI